MTGREGELVRLREDNERLQSMLDDLRSQTPVTPTPPPLPPAAPPLPVQPPMTPPGSGEVTLTFDDSSSASRARAILDILYRYDVKAVFCVEGNWARQDPDVMARVQRDGHKVCNHTASHARLTSLSNQGIRDEILGGIRSDILRPPYGAYDTRVESIAASLGYRIYLWSIDTRDWTGVPAGTIVNTVMTGLRPGAVVLMHLQGPSTLDALPQVIEGIRSAGY